MKTLKQLHEEQEKLPKVHAEVERELKKIPGVIAVDIGFKEKDGKLTDIISFIVYVQEKKNEGELPADQIIPKEMYGVKTDVVKIASSTTGTTSLPDNTKYRPIKGGIQIGNGIKDSAGLYHFGTLGCFARLNSNGNIVGLSNQHVMFAAGAHGETGGEHNGSKMGQPEFWVSCFCCDCDLIGNIITGIRDGVVDGALCTINSDVEKANEVLEIGTVSGSAPVVNVGGIDTSVRVGDPVKKRGRTTGLITGTVQSINHSSSIDGILFNGQIHVTPDDLTKRFFDRGDSGSALLDGTNRVVGLLHAFPFAGGTTNPDGTGIASKIHEVMSRLAISIPSGAFPPGGGGGAATVQRTSFSMPGEPNTSAIDASKIIKQFEKRLHESETGNILIDLFYRHRSEVRDLINYHRPVTVIWHRNEGPAYLASVYRSIKDPAIKIEKQINGVTMESLLTNMKEALLAHGSISLIQDIKVQGDSIINYLLENDTLEKMVDTVTKNN